MARHGRQERANGWGAPMQNRGKALVRDIREIVATHDLADLNIRREVETLAEVAQPNGLERATMQMEVGKIRVRQCEIVRRCTDRMFGGGYAGQEGAMATALGRILNRYRVEIGMVNLAIDLAGAREWERDWKWERGFSPSVSGGTADSHLIRGSQEAERAVCEADLSAQAQRSRAEHDARETRCRAHGEGSGAERAVCEADLSAQAQRSIATHDACETRVQTNGAERGAMAI